MIFFENNNIKLVSLIFLVAIFSIFVMWRWFESKPFNNIIISDNDLIASVVNNSETEEAVLGIKDGFDLGKLQLDNLAEEFQRQSKEKIFIEQSKNYLATVSSTEEVN